MSMLLIVSPRMPEIKNSAGTKFETRLQTEQDWQPRNASVIVTKIAIKIAKRIGSVTASARRIGRRPS